MPSHSRLQTDSRRKPCLHVGVCPQSPTLPETSSSPTLPSTRWFASALPQVGCKSPTFSLLQCCKAKMKLWKLPYSGHWRATLCLKLPQVNVSYGNSSGACRASRPSVLCPCSEQPSFLGLSSSLDEPVSVAIPYYVKTRRASLLTEPTKRTLQILSGTRVHIGVVRY